MEEIKLKIPRIGDDPNPMKLPLKKGDQLFIVGPNGSGKSALIQQFVSEIGSDKIKRISAHRQTWFDSENIDLTPSSRQRYGRDSRNYNTQDEARYKDPYGASDLSAILFDLDNEYNVINESIAQDVRKKNRAKADKTAAERPSPFDQINELLALGTLNVMLERAEDRSILARHQHGESFNIAKMSDGERSAMIIAAHVITAEPETVLLIDEPERHLHRSITQPLLSALFDLRKDCAFIISTHEIALPTANPEAKVLILRSCQWSGDQCTAWDVEVLEPDFQLPQELILPEGLKRAILGSRKRILFVEGDSNSLDISLYTALFRDLSIIPMGSCEEVQKAVLGLRGSQEIHDVEAFGLIDRDDREQKVEELAESGIFALDVYAVEALYYCSDAIAAVAHEQAKLRGEDEIELIKLAKQKALEVLKDHAKEMAARRCERKIQALTLSKIPDWKSVMCNPTQPICVSIDSPYLDELNRFNKLVENGDLDQLVKRYRLYKSNAFEILARALGCKNKRDYEQMVRVQTREDNELASKLKERIGPLSKILDQVEKQETV